MPKLSYKGNYVDFQRVRGKKGPSIQVVDKENTQQNQAKNMSKAKDNIVRDPQGLNAPEWSFLLISNGNDPNYEDDDKMEFDGFNFNTNEAKGIEITIKLPLMTTGKFFNLQISDKSLYLRCGRFYELNISLPIQVLGESTIALFDTEKRNLIVTVMFNIKEQPEVVEEAIDEPTILELNSQKIQEKNIKIESDLLLDLV